MLLTQLNIYHNKERGSALIVGGSLSGLMTAIALADQGINVTVLEKSNEGVRSGAALQVHGYSSHQSKIEEKLKKLASNGENTVQLWYSIESRLRKEAQSKDNISIHYNTRVMSVGEDPNFAWAKTQDEQVFKADVLIGADGHRSMVRAEIAPNHPHAEFAGYVVWMATFLENQLAKEDRPDANGENVKLSNDSGGFLFGSVIEVEGELNRIGCTWYDNTQTQLLYELGAVRGNFVHHSLQGSQIPQENIDSMIKEAKKNWPQPWLGAVLHAIDSRDFIGVPIKEYVPQKLISSRLAIVGDAAHVPSPITTSGFNEALKDAAVLNECASQGLKGSNAYKALEMYESLRLEKMQEMVESGRSYSKDFGRY